MESTNLQTEDDKTNASTTAAALAMKQQDYLPYKKKLPQYFQNMLLACGCDRLLELRLQIIAEMNKLE